MIKVAYCCSRLLWAADRTLLLAVQLLLRSRLMVVCSCWCAYAHAGIFMTMRMVLCPSWCAYAHVDVMMPVLMCLCPYSFYAPCWCSHAPRWYAYAHADVLMPMLTFLCPIMRLFISMPMMYSTLLPYYVHVGVLMPMLVFLLCPILMTVCSCWRWYAPCWFYVAPCWCSYALFWLWRVDADVPTFILRFPFPILLRLRPWWCWHAPFWSYLAPSWRSYAPFWWYLAPFWRSCAPFWCSYSPFWWYYAPFWWYSVHSDDISYVDAGFGCVSRGTHRRRRCTRTWTTTPSADTWGGDPKRPSPREKWKSFECPHSW